MKNTNNSVAKTFPFFWFYSWNLRNLKSSWALNNIATEWGFQIQFVLCLNECVAGNFIYRSLRVKKIIKFSISRFIIFHFWWIICKFLNFFLSIISHIIFWLVEFMKCHNCLFFNEWFSFQFCGRQYILFRIFH